MRLPTARDVQRLQQFLKASWEAGQGWLWLALMWLLIASNFTHIESILALWAHRSDWTTWSLALGIEVISGLAFSNALTNLGTMLASTGRSATKERKRRANVYFGLSLTFGLAAASFSGYVNVLWYNKVVLAGIAAPVGTVICAIMEASRRYEIRVVQERQAAGTQKEAEGRQRAAQRHLLDTLGPEAGTLRALQDNPGATQRQLADIIEKSRTTVRNHLAVLEKKGAIKRNGDGSIEVLW
jgi:DNA-binding transcriptional ArsR family regulator